MKRISILLFISLYLCFPGTLLAEVEEGTTVLSAQPDYMLTINSLSRDEQKWFKTFQEGTFLVDGWQSITADLLASTPENLREHQKQRLHRLGLKIGLEWCKENAVRRVDNKMLQQWGKELKKTAQKNPEHLAEVIVSIDQEIDNILN